MSPKHPLDHVTVPTVWFKAIPKATVQDTSLVRFVQVLCSDFWISVTLGTTIPNATLSVAVECRVPGRAPQGQGQPVPPAASSGTLPNPFPAASSRLPRAGSSSADVQDSALRLNFQHKPSGKESSKLSASHFPPVPPLIPKSPGRAAEDREHTGTGVSGNVPSQQQLLQGRVALLLGTAWAAQAPTAALCQIWAGRSQGDTGELLPLCFPSWLSPTLGAAFNSNPQMGKSFVGHQF